ncbi:MAG TPA: T9SS type A sorting domain-containing protein [Bacteroidota bacterium]|nr:T9SS type A sorting domain-containing protein [Bacteroidota bacterium]
MKKNYVVILTVIAAVLTFLPQAAQSQPSVPSGVLHSVPITLANNQLAATPPSFQEMLTINWSNYTSDLNSGVTNVEFFDTTGNVLKAWCESDASPGAISSTVWVNLGADTIPGSGTLTIYMGFLDTSINNMGNTGVSVWGEYPTATATYGEYDNGANVFSNYWNFAGTSMPGGWNTDEATNVTVNDGLSFRGANAGSGVSEGNAQQIEWATPIARPFVLEDCAQIGGVYPSLGLTYGDNLGSPIANGYGAYWASGYGWYVEEVGAWTGSGYSAGARNNNSAPMTSSQIWSLVLGPKGDTIKSQINYGSTPAALSWADSKNYDSGYVGLNTFWNDKTLYVNWARIRAYPPGGAMPTAGVSDHVLAVKEAASANLPKKFALSQNYPNPFNPATVIRYELPRSSHVTLAICDALGRRVKTLVDESEHAGNYTVRFDARSLSSGMYFYRLDAGSYHEIKKLLLLK